MSAVVRIPEETHEEITRIAAFRGEQPGHLIAEAWREYIANHRGEFAADLEQAARLLRDGTLEELTEFVNRSVPARAKRAAARLADGFGDPE
jgi:hypothetical protein